MAAVRRVLSLGVGALLWVRGCRDGDGLRLHSLHPGTLSRVCLLPVLRRGHVNNPPPRHGAVAPESYEGRPRHKISALSSEGVVRPVPYSVNITHV